eukprot:TRINITY_DN21777_c0_g1_i2.p1 TRINITY_DN21777_c0_g1~~TRINITY_DN21777_c0_g1_i2.p1  ORF type:complete len:199 (+),score=46.90 TRINITY_DN21777_c0_g1_i2:474-1070(+)
MRTQKTTNGFLHRMTQTVQKMITSQTALKMKVRFTFDTNPYFSNPVLEKVYYLEPPKPEQAFESAQVVRIESTKIDWYAGKNVTVNSTSKKPKSKRKTSMKSTPRASFFRWFRNLGPGEDIPEDQELDDEDYDSEDEEEMMQWLVHEDWEQAIILRDHVVPHAIRLYTGEAYQEEDSDEGSESEGGEEEDEEDEPMAD